MFKKSAVLLATMATVVSLSALPTPALAIAPVWATVGAGCVPTGQTSQFDLHFQTAGRTNFNIARIGQIILTCPITARLAAVNGLRLLYADPDGTGTGARVVAALRKMHRLTGAVSTVASVDSNTFEQTAFGTAGANLNGCNNYIFDQDQYHYYVQINMTRNSALLPVSFGAVELASVAIIC
jgi:hypothetical protein